LSRTLIFTVTNDDNVFKSAKRVHRGKFADMQNNREFARYEVLLMMCL
jgi:hypothetical protein